MAAYSPNTLASVKAIYNLNSHIIFAINSYYVGSMESEWNEVKNERISKTTPAYFNLGANIRYNNIYKTGLYFSIHANNLLNANIYYAPTYANFTYLPNGTYDTRIQLNATMGLKF